MERTRSDPVYMMSGNDGWWYVFQEDKITERFKSRQAAVRSAHVRAEARMPCEVIEIDLDGREISRQTVTK